MHSAIDVAYYMLKISNIKHITMSNLKLQKLVYIAHGYMLALKGEPLIQEAPQAWRYGPVIHSIYKQFKSHADQPIVINTEMLSNDQLSEDAKKIIDDVIDTYGSEDAIYLVNLTHEVDTPWDEIWNKKGGSSRLFAEIPNELIKNHFMKAVTDSSSVNGL